MEIKMKQSLGLIIGFTLFASGVHAATPPSCENLNGEWVNQLDSTLNIEKVDPATGSISGTYRSPSGTTGQKYPLVGWFNKSNQVQGKDNVTVVSFSVNWGTSGSVTSWSGTCTGSEKPTIKATWDLASTSSDFSWDHILTNSDTFTPKK
jgi:hypothetical protein